MSAYQISWQYMQQLPRPQMSTPQRNSHGIAKVMSVCCLRTMKVQDFMAIRQIVVEINSVWTKVAD